jgi:ATP-dependent Clp protease ATP-binding subunit ClpA
VFERFTEPARHTFVIAHEEARALGAGSLDTEHVLLGLLADRECVAARALGSLRVFRDEVRKRIVPRSGHGLPAAGVDLAPATKQLLQLALREALRMASPRVGTGHLALGMLGGRDTTALHLLAELGVDRDTGRARVIEAMGDGPEAPAARERGPASSIGSRLSPEARRLLRTAVRFGSTYAAGRIMSPGILRAASATSRIAQEMGSRTRDGERLRAVACSVCGTASPACGALYAAPDGSLVCATCAGSGTGEHA